MPKRHRARFVALTRLLAEQYPDLSDPLRALADRRVLVDGRVVLNPRAHVRADASVRLRAEASLRGTFKLSRALRAFGLSVVDACALDIGAAAGGFTLALLEGGARRVYAVDVGFGQMIGSLRNDPRVVNLERTNVASLRASLLPEPVSIVTMDLAYLSVASAVAQLGSLDLPLAPGAALVALVKPTYELGRRRLAADEASVRAAVALALEGISAAGWVPTACTRPAVTGRHGAVEVFVLARLRHRTGGSS